MMVPAQPNRSAANWLITFQGIIEQSLQDLIDWVEEGKVPAGTNFAFSDGKINLPPTAAERGGIQPRSEEHTSELQSLMRISYAVFCLKKKTMTTTNMNE